MVYAKDNYYTVTVNFVDEDGNIVAPAYTSGSLKEEMCIRDRIIGVVAHLEVKVYAGGVAGLLYGPAEGGGAGRHGLAVQADGAALLGSDSCLLYTSVFTTVSVLFCALSYLGVMNRFSY